MNKKLAALAAIALAELLPSVHAQPIGPSFDPGAAFFSGAITFGAPILVTNTNQSLAVPRLSVINPVTVSGTVTTVNYSSVTNTNTQMLTRESYTLTNRAINNTNLLKTVLGVSSISNITSWSFGLISRPPDDLEASYPWNLGTAPRELVAYRTSNNVIVDLVTEMHGFDVAFDLPEEHHQRGRISFTSFGDLAAFVSTNFTTVYVSLPPIQLTANFSTPTFPEVKAMATFTNTSRSNRVRIPDVSWWGTNNWPLNWLGSVGATAPGTLRGFGYQLPQ
jgi:hypothetical protein